MSTKNDCPEFGVSPEDINKLTDEIDELRQRIEGYRDALGRVHAKANHLQDERDAAERKVASVEQQRDYFRAHVEEARKRTEYPELCKHPGKCAGAGQCMAEWCCND